MKVIRQQVFGKETSPTIYYLAGHQSSIRQFYVHIRLLKHAGFRIVAFEYDYTIVEARDPERLHVLVRELIQVIKNDMSDHHVAGIYGVSFGSFLGFNIVARTDIKNAMFNTCPANLVEVVWSAEVFKLAKENFLKNGYSKADLHKAGDKYDMASIVEGLTGSHIFCMNSVDDEIITKEEYQKSMNILLTGKANVNIILINRLHHAQTVVYNLFRLRRTVRFFKSNSALS